MNSYEQIVAQIIKEQETIIGPLAFDQARKVAGIQIDSSGGVAITGNGKEVIDHLVHKYSELFGPASIQVCKDAVKALKDRLPLQDLPDILK